MPKIDPNTKRNIKKFREWRSELTGSNRRFLKELDDSFQSAVRYFSRSGDAEIIRYFVNTLDGRDRTKLAKYIAERLPFENKEDDKLKISPDWKKTITEAHIKALNPFSSIYYKVVNPEIDGNIRLEKTYANLDELHAFIMDCLVLYRKKFSREQLSEIQEVVTKIKKND